ncbi:hypothetical protein AZF01_20360 [Martelella sp. AD-3]|nr:hypothetical protein AZF01_20360 [Martelella sp. AD-3]
MRQATLSSRHVPAGQFAHATGRFFVVQAVREEVGACAQTRAKCIRIMLIDLFHFVYKRHFFFKIRAKTVYF